MICSAPQVFTVLKEMTKVCEIKAKRVSEPRESRSNMNDNVEVVKQRRWPGHTGEQLNGSRWGSRVHRVWVISSDCTWVQNKTTWGKVFDPCCTLGYWKITALLLVIPLFIINTGHKPITSQGNGGGRGAGGWKKDTFCFFDPPNSTNLNWRMVEQTNHKHILFM